MRIRKWMVAVVLTVCVCSLPAMAQTAKSSGAAFGVRQYTSHAEDTESPFGEGDLSYMLAYEFHESMAYWQIGISYTPHATATSLVFNVDSVVTPQVRLVFEEGLIMMGVGALKHYVRAEDANHWSDVRWELELGLHTAVSRSLDLRAVAYYTFEDWGEIGDFDTNQLEFGLEMSYRF